MLQNAAARPPALALLPIGEEQPKPKALKPKAENAGAKCLLELQNEGNKVHSTLLLGTLTSLSSPYRAGQSQRPTGMRANEHLRGQNAPKLEGRTRPPPTWGLIYRAKLGES